MLCAVIREGNIVTDVQQGTAPAAGWYPDPAGPGSSRWWSGQAWTDHVQPSVVAPAPVAPVSAVAPVAPVVVSPAVATAGAVPVPGMTVAGPAAPGAAPTARSEHRTQEDWHAQPSLGAEIQRHAAGSVSLSTRVPAASRRHDPYRQRNWTAGIALVLAVLSIPGLGWRSVSELPLLTQSIFAGAPIAVALLGLALSFRRGSGLILSIVAAVISGATLAAGLLIDPAVLRGLTESVLALLPL
jgi:hypothetical protein